MLLRGGMIGILLIGLMILLRGGRISYVVERINNIVERW